MNSKFTVSINALKEGYDLRINFVAELENDELNHLLAEGKVSIVYHLECAQTGFRIALSTSKLEYTYSISSKKVVGRMQICPFVVAASDLIDYVNSSFHDDYKGFKFSIDAGCVMALNNQVNLDIDKDISDLANTPSVFSIIKNDDEYAKGMVVDLDHRKIVIKIPETDYYNFKSIKDVAEIESVLNSLVVIPALTFVLEEVARRDADERFELSAYAWYRAIKKAMSKRFSCDIENEHLSDYNLLEMAQKLIDSPLSQALQTLSSGYRNTSEDDEE